MPALHTSPRSRALRVALVPVILAATLGLAAPASAHAPTDAGTTTRAGDVPPARTMERAVIHDADGALAAADAASRDAIASGLDLGRSPLVATTTLRASIGELAAVQTRPRPELATHAVAATVDVRLDTARVRAALTAATAKHEAEEAAAAAAAQAAAEAAAAQAAALEAANTPDGAKATARQMAADQYGWGDDQFSCLASLWQKESSWNYQAYNPSGATGIPQALPGDKMASAGGDWQTNASTQIAWGLGYIASVYGTPCGAWGHSQSFNWY